MKKRAPSRFDSAALVRALVAKRDLYRLAWCDVATAAGVSAPTLSRVLAGRAPDVHTFGALAIWLGADMRDFFVGATSSHLHERADEALRMGAAA